MPPDIPQVARRKLRQLDEAERLDNMRVPPGNRLQKFKGDRKGTYSLRINGQRRIAFRWSDGGAGDVRIEFYHR
ncbi:type II toxin-antitoxin system RelE/ParE family toxin [uncultured Sphingomonas sp.]|uniref:type II toxin-antitoxin system RelE/ParE family toxin n=1 Tax=uncultured Sphingomonas sp. TaxID=158754 RepID=UPI003459B43B